ncbi:MgtC/SapB family protein [Clostridium perfringens]|uniref:MgtC/SapB family protein n=2 Tax=Clostridium perfringens TaxID=1502 RepID=UPI000D716FCA|nr:MgtC/SapB family protein [Clostridium perfringens]MBI6006614.1 MgtC/SapB family protein [Clostridium perfringens]MBI6009148.1 MgtC/SapB family protein [Clostridium perfringens]MBI6018033.1 MgtC/SapB family protein [Clostridium perfringens]MCX0374864.1 MgtC/SapB family protein [Clostridium perfringens]MDK0529935.1 MgtC/SapB family protein [Clostridium perfringens]
MGLNLSLKDIIIRLLLATIVGGVIGYEREYHNRAAGFRTQILVCVGAAIVSLIEIRLGQDVFEFVKDNYYIRSVIKIDYARLGAQVISGIGFLGAGTILQNKGSVKGLTTAASLWVVACLGLAIGMGYYNLGILGFLFIFLTLVSLKKFQSKFITKAGEKCFEIIYEKDSQVLEFIDKIFTQKGVKIKSIEFLGRNNNEAVQYKNAIYRVELPNYIEVGEIINKLSINDGIIKISEYNDI